MTPGRGGLDLDLRLFVALDPPDPVRRALATRQADLRQRAGPRAERVRFAADDALHLTLQFLGRVPEAGVPAVREAIAAAAAASRPLALEVRGAGGFPGVRRPRVLWVGVEDDQGGLAALAGDLGRRLAPLGFPPEHRPLTPHVTVGRSRDPRGTSGLEEALSAAAAAPPVPWRATEVCLFRSHLSPAGARHEALARFHLGPFRDQAKEK